MVVRPFNWRDLPALHRYRQQSIFLNSALVATRGSWAVIPGALFSYFAPAAGVFTCVANSEKNDQSSIIGQYTHVQGSPFSHLVLLTPDTAFGSPGFSMLLEHISVSLGERGALRLLADVDEHSQAINSFRQNGFAIYSRQRIWKLVLPSSIRVSPTGWREANSQDSLAVRTLYSNLVPALVQQVETYGFQQSRGMVYYRKDGLMGYAELINGLRGIWIQPFFHPNAEDVAVCLSGLVQSIPNITSRPIYLCVRSYQSWLESTLEEFGAEAGSHQAVMVKHLAVSQKVLRPLTMPSLDGGQPEMTVPIVQMESK